MAALELEGIVETKRGVAGRRGGGENYFEFRGQTKLRRNHVIGLDETSGVALVVDHPTS